MLLDHLFRVDGNTRSAWAVLGVSLYLLPMRLLRYRRRDRWDAKHGSQTPSRAALATMPVPEAFKICRDLNQLEFPATFARAMSCALFKVSEPQSAGRRVTRRRKPLPTHGC